MPATDQDLNWLAIVVNSQSSLDSDVAAGNPAALSRDLQYVQGTTNNISDSDTRLQAQAICDTYVAKLENLTPAEQAENQASFAQLASHQTSDATALNGDPIYNDTEGAFTSSAAAHAANADSGASNNYFNVDQDVAAAPRIVDSVEKAIDKKLPSANAILGTTALVAVAVTAVAIGVLVLWFRVGR